MPLTLAIQNLTDVYLAMGVFALCVVVISLFRIMADEEFPPLTATKKIWGRRRGLLLHFLAHVGVPLVFGVVFLTRGVVGPEFGSVSRGYDPVPQMQIVQQFLDLQNQAAALIDHATMVLEVEIALYGPSWFGPDFLEPEPPVIVAEARETLPDWYQTIP